LLAAAELLPTAAAASLKVLERKQERLRFDWPRKTNNSIIIIPSSTPDPSETYSEKFVDDAAASERAAALVQSVGKVRQKTTASQALHMWYVYHRIIVPRYIVCRVALKRPFRYMSEKLQDHAIRTY
jgi:hypothetical protein